MSGESDQVNLGEDDINLLMTDMNLLIIDMTRLTTHIDEAIGDPDQEPVVMNGPLSEVFHGPIRPGGEENDVCGELGDIIFFNIVVTR